MPARFFACWVLSSRMGRMWILPFLSPTPLNLKSSSMHVLSIFSVLRFWFGTLPFLSAILSIHSVRFHGTGAREFAIYIERIDRIWHVFSGIVFSIIITRWSHLIVLYVTQAWIKGGAGCGGDQRKDIYGAEVSNMYNVKDYNPKG